MGVLPRQCKSPDSPDGKHAFKHHTSKDDTCHNCGGGKGGRCPRSSSGKHEFPSIVVFYCRYCGRVKK